MNNNWDGAAATTREKMEAYFEIQMPSTKAVRANDKRDILVHKGVLTLRDYKWNLKSFAGELLATQYYRISSSGRAREEHESCMGRYTLYPKAVLSHAGLERVPVYKQDDGDYYLFLGRKGSWYVDEIIGDDSCELKQSIKGGHPSPAPSKSLPWQYCDEDGSWKEDDDTLKVYPCYIVKK